jgi:AcrR family transcriptional regulator
MPIATKTTLRSRTARLSPSAEDDAERDPEPTKSRRRHAPAEERREQILRAAYTCFAEKGYHAATMDDLGRASGLSKGSLYWHFRSKEEVFLALFDSFAAEIYGAWDIAAASGAGALEILQREYEISVDFLLEDRMGLLAWAEFLNHPIGRQRMGEIYETARNKMGTIIERGRSEGSILEGPPAAQIAATLIGSIEGLMLQWLVDSEFLLKRQVEISWEILMRGLRT